MRNHPADPAIDISGMEKNLRDDLFYFRHVYISMDPCQGKPAAWKVDDGLWFMGRAFLLYQENPRICIHWISAKQEIEILANGTNYIPACPDEVTGS